MKSGRNLERIGSGNILVIRNDRLGDTILALPVVSILKERFPESQIYFMTAPEVAPIIRCVKGVDDVIEGNDRHTSPILFLLDQLLLEEYPSWQPA